MRTAPRARRRIYGLAATVLITGLLVGCGGAGEPAGDRGGAPPAGARDGQGRPEQGPTEPGGKHDQDRGSAQAPQRIPTPERSIVYIGQLTVRADDVADAAAEATRLTTTAGGFVAGDNRRGDGNQGSATLVLRVPGARFQDTVTALAELGKELDRTLTVDDVTEAVVDLDTRIASQQASVDRVRALLARADRIESIVTIERELATREAELASLQAHKRTLASQVAYSTITLKLVAPKAAVAKRKDAELGFVVGLRNGWRAFTDTVVVLLTVLGALLPFLLALAVPAALVWLGLRYRGRRAGPAATAPTSGSAHGASAGPPASPASPSAAPAGAAGSPVSGPTASGPVPPPS